MEAHSRERWAIVLGNEVRGLRRGLAACDEVVEMPQYGVKQSINVSVCAGVAFGRRRSICVMHEVRNQWLSVA